MNQLDIDQRREITQRSIDESKPRKIKSFDELMEGLSELADRGEIQAYRLLMTARGGSAGPILGEPLLEKDMSERLARIMKAAGKTMCQVSYGRAFPLSKETLKDVPSYQIEHLDFSDVKLPQTLKQLYRMFPEVKGPGFPPGFPAGRGVAAKAQWCQIQAKKMIRDRKQKEEEFGRKAQEDLGRTTSEESDVGSPIGDGEKLAPKIPQTAVFPRIGAPERESCD